MASNTPQPTTYTYPSGVLIGDFLSSGPTSPSGNDNIPTPTTVGGVNVGAILELQSTTGALLLPRMTTAQMNAINPVVNGMMIYDTVQGSIIAYESGAWGQLGGGDVEGPPAATDDSIAVFNGVTGKLIEGASVLLNPVTAIISGIVQAVSGSGTAAQPTYSFAGDNNTGMYRIAPDQIGFSANGGINFAIISSFANSTNCPASIGSTAGLPVTLASVGNDADITIDYIAKGAGIHVFKNNIGSNLFNITGPALSVNLLSVSGAITGVAPTISSSGTDVNIDMAYVTQGSGNHNFCTNSTQANINFQIQPVNNAGNYLTTFGSVAGNEAGFITAKGVDGNIHISMLGKGTGYLLTNNAVVIQTGTAPAATAGQVAIVSAVPAAVASTTIEIVGAGAGPVTVVNPTAPNRTVAIVVNGTTYYLAAKTTND